MIASIRITLTPATGPQGYGRFKIHATPVPPIEAHRCGICFESFDPDTETEYAYFKYISTAGHEQAYPDDLYFCRDCLPGFQELTDHWTSPDAVQADCAFCGDEDHDGTRLSAEFVSQDGGRMAAEVPIYDLCRDCDEIFENFLAGERCSALTVPDSWRVFGPTSRHLLGIGTDNDRVYVDPAVNHTDSGVESMSAGIPEDDANCYAVTLVKSLGTAGERPSEIAAFEDSDDAIEFAQLVALYAASAPSPTEFIDSDFEPEPMEEDPWRPSPIISSENPRNVIEKMLGYQSHHLEEALEEYAE